MLQLARSVDREQVERIAKEVHAMHVAWRPDIYEMPEELYSEERFNRLIAERQLYVAKDRETVLGYVLIKMRSYDWPGVVRRKVMLVDELAVREEIRGRGIGTAMMDDVKVLARAFGCTDLQLGVYPQNDAAVTFYKKNGLMIRSIDMQMKL